MSDLISNYEFFSGANVVVSIEDFPVSQAAGISMQIQESKVPIYGYSSRHFDAVARGRVLVSGSIIVNYVHQDYLFRLIEMALRKQDSRADQNTEAEFTELRDFLSNDAQAKAAANILYGDYIDNSQLSEAFKATNWDNPGGLTGPARLPDTTMNPNPHDSFGGLSIEVTFGERSTRTNFLGFTAFRIHDVYFMGRGMGIQIDEQTIVEEYSFIGRNLTNIPVAYSVVTSPTEVNTSEPQIDQSYVVGAVAR